MSKSKLNGLEPEQPDRWEAQLRKGAVEMAALASLWQRRLYGLEIIRYLETHSQLALAEGTIYPVLNRLKVEGLLTSEWVEAEAGHPTASVDAYLRARSLNPHSPLFSQ